MIASFSLFAPLLRRQRGAVGPDAGQGAARADARGRRRTPAPTGRRVRPCAPLRGPEHPARPRRAHDLGRGARGADPERRPDQRVHDERPAADPGDALRRGSTPQRLRRSPRPGHRRSRRRAPRLDRRANGRRRHRHRSSPPRPSSGIADRSPCSTARSRAGPSGGRASTSDCGARCGSAMSRPARRPSPRHGSRCRGRRACGGSPAAGRRRKPGTSTRVWRACRSRRPAGRRGRGRRCGGGWRTSPTSWPRSSRAITRRSISIASGSWIRAGPSCSTIRRPMHRATTSRLADGDRPAARGCAAGSHPQPPAVAIVGNAVRRRARRGPTRLAVRGGNVSRSLRSRTPGDHARLA